MYYSFRKHNARPQAQRGALLSMFGYDDIYFPNMNCAGCRVYNAVALHVCFLYFVCQREP